MTSIVVLGAGGHIGSAVARAAVASGREVTGVVRRAVLPPNLTGVGLRLRHLAEDAALPMDHALLVDAAGPHPTALRSNADIAEVARRHARRVLAANIPIVHISSWAAEALRPHDPTSRYSRRTHPYFEAKRRLEDLFLEAHARGQPVTVVRLTMVMGPWDVRARRECAIPQLVAGEHPFVPEAPLNVVDVRDVARELIGGDLGSGVTTLVGHDTTFSDAMRTLMAVADAPPARGTIPSEAAVLALVGWETLRLQPPGPPALGMMLVHEMVPDVGRRAPQARRIATIPLETTLRDAVHWYRRLGYC